MPAKEVAKQYGISLFAVECFEETVITGKPFGSILTNDDILELYLDGLTFREIGYLKGITKEGIRYLIDSLQLEKEKVKKEHSTRRKELWRHIREERICEEVDKNGVEEAAGKLGYTVRYLKILLREMKKEGSGNGG